MIEKCPLQQGDPGAIPSQCWESCEKLWQAAEQTGETEGPYDHYGASFLLTAQHCLDDIEFSHAALQAVGSHTRRYTVVDQCVKHDEDVGGQSYIFQCPYPVEQ